MDKSGSRTVRRENGSNSDDAGKVGAALTRRGNDCLNPEIPLPASKRLWRSVPCLKPLPLPSPVS